MIKDRLSQNKSNLAYSHMCEFFICQAIPFVHKYVFIKYQDKSAIKLYLINCKVLVKTEVSDD